MSLNVRTAAVGVDGLSRRYGATRALEEVDLTLERGITGRRVSPSLRPSGQVSSPGRG